MPASNGIPSGGSGGGLPVTTDHALLVGTGAKSLVYLAPSTTRNVAISDGTDWTSRALQAADIPALAYVTSVGLSLPAIFTISGSPVTGAGTLTGTLATQTANQVWAGPTTGAAAAPTFRALQAADIPALAASIITSGQLALARGGTGVDLSASGSATAILAQDASHVISARALIAADIPSLTLAKISDAGTMAAQNANAVAITGGAIDGTTVGATTPSTGQFTTAYVGVAGGPVATELTVVTTSASDPRGIMSAQYSTDALASRIHLRKARGTPAAPTTIVTGDLLGRVRFSGYDGSNFLQMASIDAVSTGTIASTRVPTYLAFSVATDAAPSVLTEVARLTITGLNNTVIGATTAAAGTFTTINGTIITASTRFVGPILAPAADSTTALKLTKADGSTAVVTVDTTNSRVGIGTTPSTALHVVEGTYFFQVGSAAGIQNFTTGNTGWSNLGTNGSKHIAAFYNASNVLVGQVSASGINVVLDVAILDHTGGTSGDGFGTGLLIRGKDSTTASINMAAIRSRYTTAAHLNAKTQTDYINYDAAQVARVAMSTGANGTVPLWGVFGSCAIQFATTGTTGGFTAGGGTAMNSASTSTGGTGSTAYTFGDLVLALKTNGQIAA
jgi:hypothetical protein